jgi:hypothetical protein
MKARLMVVMGMVAALACPAAAQAQAPASEAAAVRQVVDRLFDGMRQRDTAMMASSFHAEARLYGLDREGGVSVTPASDFVAGIRTATEGLVLDEVLGEVEIRIDGPVASVWTYYDFFAGPNFSHCGYNAFQMLKTGGEWKIVAITDSRRREGCLQQRRGAK